MRVDFSIYSLLPPASYLLSPPYLLLPNSCSLLSALCSLLSLLSEVFKDLLTLAPWAEAELLLFNVTLPWVQWKYTYFVSGSSTMVEYSTV